MITQKTKHFKTTLLDSKIDKKLTRLIIKRKNKRKKWRMKKAKKVQKEKNTKKWLLTSLYNRYKYIFTINLHLH